VKYVPAGQFKHEDEVDAFMAVENFPCMQLVQTDDDEYSEYKPALQFEQADGNFSFEYVPGEQD
jgi:hypothetical protein